MNLPRPPVQYNPENEAQTRNALVTADRDNVKKNVAQAKITMVSPNGSKFDVTVSDAGAIVVTPL